MLAIQVRATGGRSNRLRHFGAGIGIASTMETGGRSSAGRAPALHAGGQEFDPPRLHQIRD